ncbi:MAG: hypothetical protein IT236_04515, partial [Bacteroidia bacterium]|nr:hypothetical protein [Bacteroidia bacterium]
MKKNVLILIALLNFCLANAQQETRNSRAYANFLNISGCFITSHDDKFPNTGPWTNYSNRVIITLGLDEDRHIHHPNAIRV